MPSINKRAMDTITNDTKTVEVRAGDTTWVNDKEVVFTCDDTSIICDITFVHKYCDVRSLLSVEGITSVSSSSREILAKTPNITHDELMELVIANIESISTYKERIAEYGVYAIGVKKTCID